MNLLDHALADLRAQHAALAREFQDWRRRTEPGRSLRQHHTQVVRVTDTLTGALARTFAGTAIAGAPEAPAIRLEELAVLRRRLGSVHLLWDFFRDKFAQRDTEFFRSHLGAADDLAWELYRMFWQRAVAALEAAVDSAGRTGADQQSISPASFKEPPLIFYHVERNFLAQPRVTKFSVPGLEARDIKQFYYLLKSLPVPIIGLPWYQAGRLPALVFVGHEVGHVVAEDLDLDEEFDGLLEALELDDTERAVWRAWADEVFADLFGTLALGAAYVEQLAVELADGFNAVVGEPVPTDPPGSYPTRALRIALCTEALKLVGAPLERPFFASEFPIGVHSKPYLSHVPAVVEALVRGPYTRLGGDGLDAVLGWNTEFEDQVEDLARTALDSVAAGVPFSVRVWIAAATRARLRDARAYAARELDRSLADDIVSNRGPGVRADLGLDLRQRIVQVGIDPSDFSVPSPLTTLDRDIGAKLSLSLDF